MRNFMLIRRKCACGAEIEIQESDTYALDNLKRYVEEWWVAHHCEYKPPLVPLDHLENPK